MNKYIIIGLILFVGLLTFFVYKLTLYEKYKILKNIGKFPILLPSQQIIKIKNSGFGNKYDGHRYRHRRRYNHLGQNRRYQ